MTGPVIPELIIQIDSNYEQMLQAISMRGAGHVIGGIIGKNTQFIGRELLLEN